MQKNNKKLAMLKYRKIFTVKRIDVYGLSKKLTNPFMTNGRVLKNSTRCSIYFYKKHKVFAYVDIMYK